MGFLLAVDRLTESTGNWYATKIFPAGRSGYTTVTCYASKTWWALLYLHCFFHFNKQFENRYFKWILCIDMRCNLNDQCPCSMLYFVSYFYTHVLVACWRCDVFLGFDSPIWYQPAGSLDRGRGCCLESNAPRWACRPPWQTGTKPCSAPLNSTTTGYF